MIELYRERTITKLWLMFVESVIDYREHAEYWSVKRRDSHKLRMIRLAKWYRHMDPVRQPECSENFISNIPKEIRDIVGE